jgi:hypothetical protein
MQNRLLSFSLVSRGARGSREINPRAVELPIILLIKLGQLGEGRVGEGQGRLSASAQRTSQMETQPTQAKMGMFLLQLTIRVPKANDRACEK